MILKECRDFLRALGQCRPGLKTDRLVEAVGAAGEGPFEVGLPSDAPFEKARVKTAALELEWSLVKDAPLGRWTAAERRVEAAPFTKDLLSDPAAAAVLEDFVALCPPEALLVERLRAKGGWTQSARWGLRLARPEPWPRFARLNLADPLVSHSTRLAHVVAGRSVREIWFEGAALTVYVGS